MPSRHNLQRKKRRAKAAAEEVVAKRKRRRAKAIRHAKAEAAAETEKTAA